MKRRLGIFLLCSLLAWAADYKPAKLLEVQDASEVGANTVTDSSEGLTGQATFVPAIISRCRVTVALNGTSYTAIFPVNKHLKIADLSPGDFIPARIESNKLVIKTIDGKEMKAKIVRREPLEVPPVKKTAGSGK